MPLLVGMLVFVPQPWAAQAAAVPPPAAPQVDPAAVLEAFGRLPSTSFLYFVQNQGQVDARVAYTVQGHDKTLYFTAAGLTYALTGEGEGGGRWAVQQAFVGANPGVRIEGLGRTGALFSYFKGQRAQWVTGVPSYAGVAYRELWPGIDLLYRGSATQLKYKFVVRPGADPASIQLAYRGATEVRLNGEGQLEVRTPLGGFTDERPLAYQEVGGRRVAVEVAYALGDEGRYAFRLGAYNPSRPLVIDPAVLVYCGYIGGSGGDSSAGIAVDGAGRAYVTGTTSSSEATFPVTVGPDLTYNIDDDVFVARVKADGTGLEYCGYIGGSGEDSGRDIAVDGAGRAYVTGDTRSSEATFPVTVGPDLTHNGSSDAFVARVAVLFPDLSIAKSATPSVAAAGQPITYTLAFSNAGQIAASGVVITDTIPISVTDTGVISSGVAISQVEGTRYVWIVQDLAPGQGGVITISGVLSASVTGRFSNTAVIASATAEDNLRRPVRFSET